ncbi:MAG: DUF354 domain-containing protein [Candidatus Thermoplasmatota archaeon]|nr:DUF354 domain-containing protein [Candidatus Thermoplasmatota archaeon]
MIDIGTPPQVHLFRNLIKQLEKEGHELKITARKHQIITELLDYYQIEYEIVRTGVTRITQKIIDIPITDFKMIQIAKKFSPDIMLSLGSPYLSHVAKLMGKPHVVLEDTELSMEQYFLYSPFSSVIITPIKFNLKLKHKNHIRIKSYKELAYLHPNWYAPTPISDIAQIPPITNDEKYVILRFNQFGASHDLGKKGFTMAEKYSLIKELEKYATVIISSEMKLPADLTKYQVSFPSHRMHDALSQATLLVGDTQTSTTEAACLGTPAIRSNSFVGDGDMSNFKELEDDYKLIYNIADGDSAIEKAVELIQRKDLKSEWHEKRDKMLKEKIDLTSFIKWFITSYPESLNVMKEDSNYQDRFH